MQSRNFSRDGDVTTAPIESVISPLAMVDPVLLVTGEDVGAVELNQGDEQQQIKPLILPQQGTESQDFPDNFLCEDLMSDATPASVAKYKPHAGAPKTTEGTADSSGGHHRLSGRIWNVIRQIPDVKFKRLLQFMIDDGDFSDIRLDQCYIKRRFDGASTTSCTWLPSKETALSNTL